MAGCRGAQLQATEDAVFCTNMSESPRTCSCQHWRLTHGEVDVIVEFEVELSVGPSPYRRRHHALDLVGPSGAVALLVILLGDSKGGGGKER